ncbi:MAG: hypothetical protein ACKOCL_03490 [Candidatus Nanopelagicaceae bacterium]
MQITDRPLRLESHFPDEVISYNIIRLEEERILYEYDRHLHQRFRDTRTFEVLGFYRPFHYHRSDFPWGIYVYRGSPKVIAHEMIQAGSITNEPVIFDELLRPALNSILLHEKYHHAIEAAVTPFLISQNNGNSLRYDSYLALQNLYLNSPMYREFEEKSCNSFVARNRFELDFIPRMHGSSLPSSVDVGPAIRDFMKTQPPGYCDFDATLSNTETAKELLRFLNVKIQPTLVKSMAKAMSQALKRNIPKYIITSPPKNME